MASKNTLARVMKEAARLRREGKTSREALKEAWRRVDPDRRKKEHRKYHRKRR